MNTNNQQPNSETAEASQNRHKNPRTEALQNRYNIGMIAGLTFGNAMKSEYPDIDDPDFVRRHTATAQNTAPFLNIAPLLTADAPKTEGGLGAVSLGVPINENEARRNVEASMLGGAMLRRQIQPDSLADGLAGGLPESLAGNLDAAFSGLNYQQVDGNVDL